MRTRCANTHRLHRVAAGRWADAAFGMQRPPLQLPTFTQTGLLIVMPAALLPGQDCVEAISFLPDASVDLLVLDPPYNLNRQFGCRAFKSMSTDAYAAWMDDWLCPMLRLLKPSTTVYVCGDWRSAAAIHEVLARHLVVRNRITWEREKGRGALTNWKNCSQDIWFATVSDTYTFNLEAVRLRRRVLAPYRDANGLPKDWQDGYRDTCPSNLWSDMTVPFWSMPENTEHPTQKPEKLLAKLILASSNAGQLVLDPTWGACWKCPFAKQSMWRKLRPSCAR